MTAVLERSNSSPASLNAAVALLPARQRRAIRLHLQYGMPVSKIAAAMGVDMASVYRDINLGRAALRSLNVDLPDEGQMDEPRRGPGRPAAATSAELVATLARMFPNQWVVREQAEETLRGVHGRCSTLRAEAAQRSHNAQCTGPQRRRRFKARDELRALANNIKGGEPR